MSIGSNQPAVINNVAITGQGKLSFLNISTATVVKGMQGRIVKVNVVTAGSTFGYIYDSSTNSGLSASNLIASIPESIGTYVFDFPCANGIVIVPGTGQVVSVSYA